MTSWILITYFILPLSSPHITNHWAVSSIFKMLFYNKPSCKALWWLISWCSVNYLSFFLWVLIFAFFVRNKYHLLGGNVHLKILFILMNVVLESMCSFVATYFLFIVLYKLLLDLFGSLMYEKFYHYILIKAYILSLPCLFSLWYTIFLYN